MATLGQRVVQRFGTGVTVSATGHSTKYKVAGVTVAWQTVAAASSDTAILPSYSSNFNTPLSSADQHAVAYVSAGEKALRLGTVLCRISGGTYAGKFAPYGTGSGSLAGGTLLKGRNNMYVIDSTVYESDQGSDFPTVIEGGDVYLERIVQNGSGAADTLAGPTKAELDAAFPTFLYV